VFAMLNSSDLLSKSGNEYVWRNPCAFRKKSRA